MANGYGLASPDEATVARRKVYDQFLDLDPALEQEQEAQRQAVKTGTMRNVFQAVTQAPGAEGKLAARGALKQGQQAVAGLLPQQAQQRQEQAATGAGMEQAIAGTQAQQALAGTQFGLERGAADYARAVAQEAFQAGLDAKKAIFHANAAFADEAFNKLASDFEAGRVSRAEIQSVLRATAQRLTERKAQAEQQLREAWLSFKAALEKGNAEKEKNRVIAALETQKRALEDAARTQMLASILSGVVGIGGKVAGAASGGPH